MQYIINGIGKLINDATRTMMGIPVLSNTQNPPCSTCGQKTSQQDQPQNPTDIIFNADKAPASAAIRQNITEQKQEVQNTDNTILKFN